MGSVYIADQAPSMRDGLLTKLRLDLKFDYNAFVYIFYHIQIIITKFFIHKNSTAVLVCAKFCCDCFSLIETITVIIFIEFRN